MNQSFLRDLPKLIEEKIIDEGTAQRIRDYYDTRPSKSSNVLTSILTAAGALLAGLGIILIIAHNWDNLGSTTKTIFAFLPLLVGQGLCFYSITRKKGNRVWGEASAIFLFCAVGASIALIGQIYHIDGTLRGFLLTWILLTLPLVYLVPSRLVALLCIICISWYATEPSFSGNTNQLGYFNYPLLMLILLPFYYNQWKNYSGENYFHFLNWFVVISLLICLQSMSAGNKSAFPLYSAAYLSLLCFFYWVGKNKMWKDRNIFTNPFRIAGALGVLIVLLLWSYSEMWNFRGLFYVGEGQENFWNGFRTGSIFQDQLFYVFAGSSIAVIYLFIRNYKKEHETLFDPTGLSILLWFLAICLNQSIGIILINIWILFCGIYFVRKGALKENFGILNFGLLWIAILATCRFFDDSIAFAVRGLFFLLTGIAFFAGNYILIKNKKAKKTGELA